MPFLVNTHTVAMKHADDAVLMKRHRIFVVLFIVHNKTAHTHADGVGISAVFNPDDLTTVNCSFGKQE